MPRARSVSLRQLDELLRLMEENKSMATGRITGGPLGHQRVQKFWNEVTSILNSLPDGTTKHASQWKAYWHDLKYRARKRASDVRSHGAGTGGGPSIRTLTDTESRILQILGSVSYEGNVSVQIPLHFDDIPPQLSTSPEIAAAAASQQQLSSILAPSPLPLLSEPPSSEDAELETPSTHFTPPAYPRINALRVPPVQQAPRVRPQNNSSEPPHWARLYEERRLDIDARREQAQDRIAQAQERIANGLERLIESSSINHISSLLEDIIQLYVYATTR